MNATVPTVVLHMLPDFAVGGGQILLLRNLAQMPAADWRHIVCALEPGPLEAAFADAGVQTAVLNCRGWSAWPAALSRVRRIITSEGVAIIHTNNTRTDRVMGQLAALATGRPVINTLHARTSPPKRRPDGLRGLGPFCASHASNFLNRSLGRATIAAFVAVSRHVRDSQVAALDLPASRVTVIHPGLPSAAYRPRFAEAERQGLLHSLGAGGKSPVLISVGRLVPGKGHRRWLPVIASLREIWPDICLLLVGEGPDRAAIEADIARLGLDGSVVLLGSRGDVADLLRAADLSVSASDSEGFGLALLESMAVGTPVVAVTLPAIREFIVDGVNGCLVPSFDEAALRSALGELLSDRERLDNMGRAARETAQKFSIDVTVGALQDLYRSVLLGNGRRAVNPAQVTR